jgi:hypothetical protein
MFRPRFSLRTLFAVVTITGVVAGWAAQQLNWIRQRHEFLRTLNIAFSGTIQLKSFMPVSIPAAPWQLAAFGESPCWSLRVTSSNLDLAHRLFPETLNIYQVDSSAN